MKNCYVQLRSTVRTAQLQGKKVFVRADLNVPFKDGIIQDDYRLRALLPTLHALQHQGAFVILATHLGRPEGKYDPAVSTKQLVPWFEQQGFSVFFAPDVQDATTAPAHASCILLENLRFFPGEQGQDIIFAQQLRRLADYYINDAFASAHRTDTSVTLLPELFAPSERSIGLLVEEEIAHLAKVYTHARPRVAVLGGAKVATKLPLIEGLLDHMDAILLCPALVFTFLKAADTHVGLSVVDDLLLEHARSIMQCAQKKNIALLFPHDYLAAHQHPQPPFFTTTHLENDMVGIAIGPRTVASFIELLSNAQTLFFNGPMGFAEFPETQESTCALLRAMARTSAYSVLGGGDSLAVVTQAGVRDAFSYISTGGGAMLAFLSDQSLPALDVFCS